MELNNKGKIKIIDLININFNTIIFLFSEIIALIAFIQRNNIRSGLELLYLLPLIFGICMIVSTGYNSYLKGGIAIKIYLVIMIIRYVCVPLLIIMTQGKYNASPITMPMISVSRNGYQYSILVSIIDLIVSFTCIYVFNKSLQKNKRKESYSNYKCNTGISIFGIIGLLVLIFFLLTRDLKQVFSLFTFFTINEKYENPSIDAFGILTISTIKMFIFIRITTMCSNKYNKSKNSIWVIIAIITGFLNMSIFFGYNRSFVLQTGIATIYILYTSFPKYRKILAGIMIPLCSLIVISMIFIKQFGVSYTDTTISEQLNLPELANTIECYVGGPWSLGSGYDAYMDNSNFNPVSIFLKDFIHNNFISYMPGLEFSLDLFPNTISSPIVHQIYTKSYQMIPLSSNTLFYGGKIFGIVISITFNIIFMKILVTYDYKSKWSRDISKKYIYTLIAILFSFTMCYTWVTLLWSFTKNMLFISLLIYINQYHFERPGKIKYIKTI